MHYVKFGKSRYIDAFFADGTMRVGTLYEYRDEEKHGKAIGDEHEGKRYTDMSHPSAHEFKLGDGSPSDRFFGSFLNKQQPNIGRRDITVRLDKGANFHLTQESEQLYVYCFSGLLTIQKMPELGDAAMEIEDLKWFLETVHVALAPHLLGGGHCEAVTYSDRTRLFTTPHTTHPAFLKSKEYEGQREWRVVWNPRDTAAAQPLVIKVPEARRYCRRLYLP